MNALLALIDWSADDSLTALFDVGDLTVDQCRVEKIESDEPTFTDILIENFKTVGDIETVILSSTAGTYGELTRHEIRGEGFLYFHDPDLTFPSPAQLSVHLPQELFDGALVLPTKPDLIQQFSLDNDEQVDRGDTLTWTASSDFKTLLSLSLMDSSDTLGFSVDCLLKDDGSFALPASVFDEAEAIVSGSSIVLDDVSRVSVEQVNSSSSKNPLVVGRSVGVKR